MALQDSGTSLEALAGPDGEGFISWSSDTGAPPYKDWTAIAGTHSGEKGMLRCVMSAMEKEEGEGVG